MTNRSARLLTLLSTILVGDVAAAPAGAEPPPAATITATVGKLRNGKGSVQCSLHATDRGFPGGKPFSIASVTKLDRASATCVFPGVRPGTYAIAVLHDENNNGKLDTNWLGIPKEGYGASNNKLHTFSAPTFTESRFVVARGDVELAISLKY